MKLVLHGLIGKRAEIVGKIESHRDQLAQLLADLDSIDRSIRIFDPQIDLGELPAKPVPPPNAAFRGEVQRFLLFTLRHADTGMTTYDLAKKLMENRNLNTADKALLTLMAKRTGHSLSQLRAKGFIVSEKANGGGLLRWRVSLKGETQDNVGGWRNGSMPAAST